MTWRGAHLMLVAALGGVLWVLAGGDPGRDGGGGGAPAGETVQLGDLWPSGGTGAAAGGEPVDEPGTPVDGGGGDLAARARSAATTGSVDGRAVGAVRAPMGRSAGTVRVMRLIVVIAVVLAGARLYGVRPRFRRGDPQAAGQRRWWFTDPGRLRGPPAI